MDKLVIIFILVAYLSTCHLVIADRRPVRSVLAPAETINNYETVSPIIIYQSAEKTHGNPHDLWIKIDIPGKKFELHLTMNRNLLSPKYTQTFVEDGKAVYSKDQKNCFYHGTVIGFADWTVAVSTCAGLRGIFGNYEDIHTLYHIEPLGRTSNEIEQTHIVYNTSELSAERRNGTCGCNNSHTVVVPHENLNVTLDRVRRGNAQRVVEWYLYNDRSQYISHGRSIKQTEMHSVELANNVDALYTKIGIRISLVGVEIWSQRDMIDITRNAETLLDNFQAYLRYRTQYFDSALLITGIKLNGGTLGIATIGMMCLGRYSSGLASDTGSSVAFLASIAAHELGHILNMNHDDGRGCTCYGTNNRCIMKAHASRPPPVEWSSCSVSDMKDGFLYRNLDRCLFSEKTTSTFGGTKCGDGIREGDEMCDCGTSATCDDPCCNPNTCQLVNGAACSIRDLCCSNCQFKASGMVCRSAKSECDIPEYCSGNSGECPADRSRQDGVDCANGQAYCFSGICQDLDVMCNASFAPKDGIVSSVGPQKCFNFNTAGTVQGNCGHTGGQYKKCYPEDVRCGQLHCQDSGHFRLSVGAGVIVSTKSFYILGEGIVECRSFTTRPGADIMPGLVPNGAKCDTDKLCRNQQCVARTFTSCPTGNFQECSGHGVCNDLNQCSCYPGFTGDNCYYRARSEGGGRQWKGQLK